MRAPAARRLGPLPLAALAAVLGALAAERGAPTLAVRIARDGGAGAAIAGRLAAGLTAVVVLALAARRPAAARATAGTDAAVDPRVLPGLAVVVATACVAAVGVGVRAVATATGPLPVRVAHGGAVALVGRVATEPRRVGERWQTVVTVDRVDGRPARARVVVLRDEPLGALGDHLRLRATVGPLPDGGYGRWLARQHAVAMAAPVGAVEVRPAGAVLAASERLRAGLRREAAVHAAAAPAGLVVGLVTGDVRGLPDPDAEAMRTAGLSHLTAVSGSNVALVLGGVVAIATALRLPARARWVLLVAATGAFALLTRFEPSVLRAGTMAVLVVLAAARGVARDGVHLLAGAVLVLVLLDPLLAGSLGLLLSAGATLGVLVIAPAVLARLPPRLPRPVASLVAVSVGAQVAVAPLLVATFGAVPLVSLPANLLAVPLAAVASAIASASAVLVPVAPDLAARGLAAAAHPAAVVLAVAHRAAATPMTVGAVPVLAAGAVGASAMVLASARRARRRRARAAGAARRYGADASTARERPPPRAWAAPGRPRVPTGRGEGPRMPKYLFTGSYTAEGVRALLADGGTARLEATERMVASLGGRVVSYDFVMGEDDFVLIAELPGDVEALSAAMSGSASGSLRVRTTRLVSPAEMDAVGRVRPDYHAPGE